MSSPPRQSVTVCVCVSYAASPLSFGQSVWFLVAVDPGVDLSPAAGRAQGMNGMALIAIVQGRGSRGWPVKRWLNVQLNHASLQAV